MFSLHNLLDLNQRFVLLTIQPTYDGSHGLPGVGWNGRHFQSVLLQVSRVRIDFCGVKDDVVADSDV
jgi:hypothetical protein